MLRFSSVGGFNLTDSIPRSDALAPTPSVRFGAFRTRGTQMALLCSPPTQPGDTKAARTKGLIVTCVHLCCDMQRMFSEKTDWHTSWMPRVLPRVRQLVPLHRDYDMLAGCG